MSRSHECERCTHECVRHVLASVTVFPPDRLSTRWQRRAGWPHEPHVNLKKRSQTMKNAAAAGPKFQQLVEIMQRLRGPDGCPWDREQTFDTIKPYTLEETYEVIDAIDRRDYPGLAEELGDFMLQAVFYAQMAAEQDLFSIGDALDAINQKLVRRHPHVFGEQSAENAGDVLRIWGEVKAAEKKDRGAAKDGLLT